MKKVGQVLKSTLTAIGAIWLCLALLTMMAMMVGNMYFSSGQSHVRSANMKLVLADRDGAIVELRKAANDGLVGHRIAVGVYSMGQVLLPVKWNEFAQLRMNTLVEIDKIKEDLRTTLAVKVE